jgi:transposase
MAAVRRRAGAGSCLQIEIHVRHPSPSADPRETAICCRSFTPAQLDYPAASLEDYCSGAGAPWRDTPERYGNWNSVFVRFSRWSEIGVWDAAFETLASLGPPADEEHAIDSTNVRAHQHAAGVNGGLKNKKRSAARAAASRPKSTSARTPTASRLEPGRAGAAIAPE